MTKLTYQYYVSLCILLGIAMVVAGQAKKDVLISDIPKQEKGAINTLAVRPDEGDTQYICE